MMGISSTRPPLSNNYHSLHDASSSSHCVLSPKVSVLFVSADVGLSATKSLAGPRSRLIIHPRAQCIWPLTDSNPINPPRLLTLATVKLPVPLGCPNRRRGLHHW